MESNFNVCQIYERTKSPNISIVYFKKILTVSFCLFSIFVLFHHYVTNSPGLVVMGGDSCSDALGFESQHLILAGHSFV